MNAPRLARCVTFGLLGGWALGGCAGSAPPPAAPPSDYSVAAEPQSLPGLANFARVSSVLYRGAQPTRQGFERLRSMGVKTVADLRGRSHRDDLDGLGFQYVRFPSDASRPDPEDLIEFLRLVRDPDAQPVFVHDDRGADRVGLFVATYRRVEQGWTAKDALAEMNVFHFSPYWARITDFVERMDVNAIHRATEQPESRPTTRKSR